MGLARSANAARLAWSSSHPIDPAMRCDCRACGGRGTVETPSRAWWGLVALAWALLLGFGACFAILLPLNLVLVPAWLACATAVGPMARRVTEPRCRACRATDAALRQTTSNVDHEASRAGRVASEVAGGLARPADERAMEGALIGEPDEERDLRERPRAMA